MTDVYFAESARKRKRDWYNNDYYGGDRQSYSKIAKMAKRSYRRPQTRTKRRRNYRSRRRQRRMASGIPYSMVSKIKTSFTVSLDPGAGTVSANIIKLNSAKDLTGDVSATAQGLYIDQFEGLYKKYAVLGYKLVIEAATADNTNPVMIGFTPTTESSALSSYANYRELPGTASRMQTPDNDKVTFVVKGGIKKWILPRGGKLLTDDECTALFANDPAKILYGHLWAQAADGSTDVGTIRVVCLLTQIVKFFDRKSVARSTQ